MNIDDDLLWSFTTDFREHRVEISIKNLSPLERRRHSVVIRFFVRLPPGDYRLEQGRIYLRSANLFPIQHFMGSAVSIRSVFRQASLNYWYQSAAVFIDRKYMVLIIGSWFRKRDFRS